MSTPLPSRRALLAGTSALGIAAVLGLAGPGQPWRATPAHAQKGPATVSVDELMKPGALPDMFIGDAKAPVTIVEYASMTCPHCASFHNNVLPKLKEKYIDTGKARIVFREFPLDNLGTAVNMLARCTGTDAKAMAFISDMFRTQEKWAFSRENPLPRLFEMARQAGFTQESFDKCLTDQALLDKIKAVQERGSKTFGVSSTPTFFINGRRLQGGTFADFEKAIDPLLKS